MKDFIVGILLLEVVPPGFEPGTHGFSVRCSTNCAMAPFLTKKMFAKRSCSSFADAKVGVFCQSAKFLLKKIANTVNLRNFAVGFELRAIGK